MDNFFDVLLMNPIFRGINPGEADTIFKDKLYRIKNADKEESVAFANETVENLMFIVKGSVRGEMTDFSGKTIKIEDIAAPRPIAPAFIFGAQNKYPVDIIANEPTILFVLPKESFIKILQQNAIILKNYLDVISNRAQFLSDKIRFLSFRTIKGKIASYILKIAGKDNRSIQLNQTQNQLADYFGVTRPSLARALGEMVRDEIIEIDKKQIIIKDRKKLSDLLQ